MSNDSTTPRIYVADVAACHTGHQRGIWIEIDSASGSAAIRGEVTAMLATSPIRSAVEWAIRDHYGFGGLEIGEHDSIERISAIADLLADYPAEVVAAFVYDWGSRPIDELRTAFRDAYRGRWDSREQYAEEVLAGQELLAQVPDRLRGCLELGRLLRDSERSGELWTVETTAGIHIIANTY